MSEAAVLTDCVAAVLRGDPDAAGRAGFQLSTEFFEAADRHGVLLLVGRMLRDSKWTDDIPSELSESLSSRARCDQSVELVRREELRRVVGALHSSGISSIVFKGAALAYTHYEFPHLRPRLDTDLLIAPDNRLRARDVLESIGYTPANVVARDALFTEAMFHRKGIGTVHHVLDLHWRVISRPLFREVLTLDEIHSSVVTVPALGPAARTLDPVHALLLACIHPVAHHHSDWRLIWLYDVALLADRLNAAEWLRFRQLATARHVSCICKHAFELVARHLGERDWLRDSGMLAIPDRRRYEEASAAYLEGRQSAWRDLLLDLNASRGLLGKSRLLLAHAFPDLKYMRAQYSTSGWLALTSAYIRRLAGACVQLARSS
jgi:hypothetical protein